MWLVLGAWLKIGDKLEIEQFYLATSQPTKRIVWEQSIDMIAARIENTKTELNIEAVKFFHICTSMKH